MRKWYLALAVVAMAGAALAKDNCSGTKAAGNIITKLKALQTEITAATGLDVVEIGGITAAPEAQGIKFACHLTEVFSNGARVSGIYQERNDATGTVVGRFVIDASNSGRRT